MVKCKTLKINGKPACEGIVGLSVVVCVEELLEPLDELEVVTDTALDEAIDGNDLVHVHLRERRLDKITEPLKTST